MSRIKGVPLLTDICRVRRGIIGVFFWVFIYHISWSNQNGDIDKMLRSVGQNLQSYIYEVPVQYADLVEIKKAIQSIFNLSVVINYDQRSIHYYTYASQHKHVRRLIQSLDVLPVQMRFDVEIIEISSQAIRSVQSLLTSLTNGYSIGYNFSTGSVQSFDDLSAIIQASIQNGTARVLAKPQLISINSKPAEIQIGDRVPYVSSVFDTHGRSSQVTYVDTGIHLSIYPHIVASKNVMVDIEATVSAVKLLQHFGHDVAPLIANRQMKSRVLLRHNEPLVIAGLLDESNQTSQLKVPVLGDIPILGGLFRQTRHETIQTDILFIITPRLDNSDVE